MDPPLWKTMRKLDLRDNINLNTSTLAYIYVVGLSVVQSISSSEDGSGAELHYQNKFYALAAASALIKYIEFTEGNTIEISLNEGLIMNVYREPNGTKEIFCGVVETHLLLIQFL